MVLSEVEEIITTMELDEETFEEIYKVTTSFYAKCVIHVARFCCRPQNEVFRCCLSEETV